MVVVEEVSDCSVESRELDRTKRSHFELWLTTRGGGNQCIARRYLRSAAPRDMQSFIDL